jgi:hypothetical protein
VWTGRDLRSTSHEPGYDENHRQSLSVPHLYASSMGGMPFGRADRQPRAQAEKPSVPRPPRVTLFE